MLLERDSTISILTLRDLCATIATFALFLGRCSFSCPCRCLSGAIPLFHQPDWATIEMIL
jgi:hypothetical protein